MLELFEIIKENNVKHIYVIVLYWTKKARKEIEKTIDIIYDKTKLMITPLFPEENELECNKHQIELANNIYGDPSLRI